MVRTRLDLVRRNLRNRYFELDTTRRRNMTAPGREQNSSVWENMLTELQDGLLRYLGVESNTLHQIIFKRV